MSNLLETWRQQSVHNIIVDTEADDNGDDADNEMFEAAMPFVIIRGNINGQIRHGISCPAFQSKKGNLSNLSSPPPPPSPNLHHYYCLQHMGHVTSLVLDFPSSLSRYEQYWWWQECLWRCRRVARKARESRQGVNIHTRLTNASPLSSRAFSRPAKTSHPPRGPPEVPPSKVIIEHNFQTAPPGRLRDLMSFFPCNMCFS